MKQSCKTRQPLSIEWSHSRLCLYWCTHSSHAQLAVSKLLWDLYCRNALAGNSSLSFILFVCVKFPLWLHPFSHPVPGFVHPSMGALCQCWLHPGGCNHIRAGPECHRGAFSPPICISPICWRGPWRVVFSIAQASKKTLMLHLISSEHSWPRMAKGEGAVVIERGRKAKRGNISVQDWLPGQATTQFAFSPQIHQ